MSRRWSDAQYTGRYLRRTIVHGKGEARPKHKQSMDSKDENSVSGVVWVIIILIVIGLIILYTVSKALFCVVMMILILVVLAM